MPPEHYKKYVESIKRYAKRNNLEIVFSQGHRYFDKIFYDKTEGKYYDRETDLFLPNIRTHESLIK
jgi:hypothetical protein